MDFLWQDPHAITRMTRKTPKRKAKVCGSHEKHVPLASKRKRTNE
jgi:hypothetical protein